MAAAYICRDVTEARTMTPQERELVTELFDRLATLETQPRDPDAERAILDGLRRAPNATYALVQTTLVQDEALKRADARIQELEAQLGITPADQPTGFLDGIRDALLGPREPARGGSVPSVRPAQAQTQDRDAAPPWRAAPAAPGGSFLGTAAAAAAGAIGGSLLLGSIRSMMGHGHGASALADPAFGAGRDLGSPWDKSGGGELARQAGVDDIGRSQHAGGGGSSGLGLLDSDNLDDEPDADQDVAFDDSDSGGFDGGDFGGGDSSDNEA
jgi:hypothetical protein